MFQCFSYRGADVWNKTAVKQCCRWSALFHVSAHPWNWNKTLKQPETVLAFAHPKTEIKQNCRRSAETKQLTVGSFVFFQFYFTMCDLHKLKFIHVWECEHFLNCVKPIHCNVESLWSLMSSWYGADLCFISPQFKLQENGYWASESCGVPAYSTAFTGTHWPSPEDLAQFMNCYVLVILTVLECYGSWKVAFLLDHFVCKFTVSQKNCAAFIFTVTLANVGRFLKFFQCRNQKEMAHNKNEKFPTVA